MKSAISLLVLGALLYLVDQNSALHRMDTALPAKLLMPVSLGESHARNKRQSLSMTQPFRILPLYDDNVVGNLGQKASLVQDTIIPKLLGFLEQSLSVAPLSGPILLNNLCTTDSFIIDSETGQFSCAEQCAPITTCGVYQVPTDHLKQCRQCDGSNNCVVGTPAQDGSGVTGYDFVLYITADQSECPVAVDGAQTVAFARSCQTEMVQDRPVAGTINFCPDGVQNRDADFAFAVSKHEILHALGFASFLFALWRDPATNQPRTARGVNNGLPPIENGSFVIDENTVDSVTYDDWVTSAGTIPHTVTRLVTPAVREEARSYFDCPTLLGVELENQGGPGTAMDHWEKRVLGNEAMTGQLTFNPVFSRFTFAALEDSGWYSVNYSLADELVWGRGAGCRFAEGSCREWLDEQIADGIPLSPFCTTPESTAPPALSCTADREAVSRCNLVRFTDNIDVEYQYFDDPRDGGRVTVADFCPIQDVFTYTSQRGTTCAVASNIPTFPNTNTLLEVYGEGTRCLTHGTQWTIDGQPLDVYGGGCYEYSCDEDEDQVTIAVDSQELVCACSQAGEERTVDVTVSGQRYQGSIVCPPCVSICHGASSVIESISTASPLPTSSNTDRPSHASPSSQLALHFLVAATLISCLL